MSRCDALCAPTWTADLGANAVSNARTKPAHRRMRPAQPDADTFTVWGRLRLPPKGLCNPPTRALGQRVLVCMMPGATEPRFTIDSVTLCYRKLRGNPWLYPRDESDRLMSFDDQSR